MRYIDDTIVYIQPMNNRKQTSKKRDTMRITNTFFKNGTRGVRTHAPLGTGT